MRTKFMMAAFLLFILIFSLLAPGAYSYGREKASMQHIDIGCKFFSAANLILENSAELTLSDEQANRIKALQNETEKSLIRSEREIELVEVDIKAQLHGDMIDPGILAKFIDQKYELKKMKDKALVESIMSLNSILTEEQRKTLTSLSSKCKKEAGRRE